MLEQLRARAKAIKRELTALYFAYKHPAVPWYAKLFTAIIIGYAISPIDLIPDFIPILGFLDDLILIPAGIALALKMIPRAVMHECRIQAAEKDETLMGRGWVAAAIIVFIWGLVAWIVLRRFI